MQRIVRSFPLLGIGNIRLFYILTILTNCWFVEGNWFFYWTRFMTITQVGLLFAILSFFGLILEIPTGAIADRFGRKATVVAAFVTQSVGLLLISAANGFWILTMGAVVFEIGLRLMSGALEALVYDTLLEQNKQDRYDEIAAKSTQLATVVGAITILVGGALYLVHFRIPYILWGLSSLAGLAVSLRLIEPQKDMFIHNVTGYFSKMKDGIKQLGAVGMRPFILVMFVYLSVYVIYDWGFVKPAMAVNFGFFDREQAIIYASLAVMCTYLLNRFAQIRKKIGNDLIGIRLMTLIMGVGFLLSTFKLGWFGILPFILIEVSGHLAYPWISVVINRETQSAHRATTLSALAMLTNIPYMATIWIIGSASDTNGIGRVCLVIGLFVLAVLLHNVAKYKNPEEIT